MIESFVKTKDGQIYRSGRQFLTDLCPHGKILSEEKCPEGCEFIHQRKIGEMYSA